MQFTCMVKLLLYQNNFTFFKSFLLLGYFPLCNSYEFLNHVNENKKRFVEKLAFYLNILLNLEDELKVYYNSRAIINKNFAAFPDEDQYPFFELKKLI